MLKAKKTLETRLRCEFTTTNTRRVFRIGVSLVETMVGLLNMCLGLNRQSNRLLVYEKNKSNNNKQNAQLLRFSFIFKANYLRGISTKPCTAVATMQKTIRKVTCSLSRFTRSTNVTASPLSTTPTRYHSAQSGIWVSGNLLKKLLSVTLN